MAINQDIWQDACEVPIIPTLASSGRASKGSTVVFLNPQLVYLWIVLLAYQLL